MSEHVEQMLQGTHPGYGWSALINDTTEDELVVVVSILAARDDDKSVSPEDAARVAGEVRELVRHETGRRCCVSIQDAEHTWGIANGSGERPVTGAKSASYR